MSPRGTTRPVYFLNCGSSSAYLKNKYPSVWRYELSFFLRLLNDIVFAVDFRQLPCRYFLSFSHSFVHRGFLIRYFHCLKLENELVQKIVMTQWIGSQSYNVMSMILRLGSFQTLSHRFVGFHELQVSPRLFFLILQGMAASSGTSKLFLAFFQWFLQTLHDSKNDVNTFQLSCSVELRCVDCPVLFLFSLSCF